MNSAPKEPARISVLVTDDSAFMRTALTRLINSDPHLWVVGTATNGREALEKVAELNPDVVTLDVDMPGVDGLEALRRIMAQHPRPVIMVSSLTSKGAEVTVNALCAGAFDFLPKQLSSTSLDVVHLRDDLITKIKAAASTRPRTAFVPGERKPPQAVRPVAQQTFGRIPEIVAVGTSTGGPKALQEILVTLPSDLSVAILIVQHMPSGFTAPFAERLDRLCAISVREASHGDIIQPGTVYIAPSGLHLTVQRPTHARTVIQLSHEPAHQLHTPSVDVMMESVATAFGPHAMGIVMTGMGTDGARGRELYIAKAV
jgi:two-component system, chemotaxis family, protein-glutamate methylesterase/glutaminase